jgi:hypothetical protein
MDKADLSYYINEAEREVLQHYTRRREDVRFRVSAVVAEVKDGVEHIRDTTRDAVVFLRYYKEDPSNIDTSDPQRQKFVDAMRREIAGVAEYMAGQQGRTQGVTSKSQGARSVSYSSGRVSRFPPDFGRYLNPFDLRPKTTHI